MKSFITAVCIGVFMVVGCVLYLMQIEKISEKLIELNNETIILIEEEKFQEAEDALKKVSDYLEEELIMLAATGNHTELDQMQIYISQLSEYIAQKHKADALANCKALRLLFMHLPKNYRLKAENIL